jgi:hypothetical protein
MNREETDKLFEESCNIQGSCEEPEDCTECMLEWIHEIKDRIEDLSDDLAQFNNIFKRFFDVTRSDDVKSDESLRD